MPADQLSDLAALFAPLAGFRRVGLAVSGGPDSLALMLLYDRWRREDASAPAAIVYSVDHGLRFEASTEAAYVVAEAGRLGLAARALRWEGDKPAAGIQAAARAARYSLIADAMAADGAEALVTGHHLDDQAETVLMRLAHGSGLEGLKGMRPVAEIAGLTVVRPLLGIRRAELAEIAAAAGLVPVADPSNADPQYERVRWRRALPEFAALGLTPERVALFARRMADADEALALAAITVAAGAVAPREGGGLTLSRAELLRQPRAIGVRILTHMLDEVGGGTKPHDLGAVEALHRRLTAIKSLRPVTLHNCLVSSDGAAVSVVPETGRRPRRRQHVAEPMGA